MWFMYEYTENEITELNQSYDTRLSEEEKKKIFIPIYDCMKKYQGSWHMEQKPAFKNCFLIECRDRDDLADMLHRLQCADILAEHITANAIALLPEQEVFLRNLMMPETKKISMSTGYIKDGRTYVTKGPLQGREKMISRIDRHKRLAKLRFAAGNTDRELCAGLEIISKSRAYKINKPASKKEEKANEGEQCDEEQNRIRSQSL